MVDPISAGFMVAGGIAKGVGSVMQGNAEAEAAEFDAGISMKNAKLAEERAAEDERQMRVMARKQIGSARASYGASGAQVDGSVLDVLEESAANAELDALKIRHQGSVEAWGHAVDADRARAGAKNARTAGAMGAVSAALDLGSSITKMARK